MQKKYLLLGGDVFSKSDGNKHFVSARRLQELYQLDPEECVYADFADSATSPRSLLGVNERDLIALGPRPHGDYAEYLAERLRTRGGSVADAIETKSLERIVTAIRIQREFKL
jgi:hypothetical protein